MRSSKSSDRGEHRYPSHAMDLPPWLSIHGALAAKGTKRFIKSSSQKEQRGLVSRSTMIDPRPSHCTWSPHISGVMAPYRPVDLSGGKTSFACKSWWTFLGFHGTHPHSTTMSRAPTISSGSVVRPPWHPPQLPNLGMWLEP